MMLNEMLKEDMPRLEMKRDDIDGGWMRDEAIEALCFDAATGRVRAYLPDEFRDMYDADPDVEFGVREGEVSIYDMYLEADGREEEGPRRSAAGPADLGRRPFTECDTFGAYRGEGRGRRHARERIDAALGCQEGLPGGAADRQGRRPRRGGRRADHRLHDRLHR